MKKLVQLFLSLLLLVSFTGIKPSISNAATYKWNGKWTRVSNNNPSTLTITKETTSSFYFEINAAHGSNMAYIDGKAKKSGNKASFSINEFGDLTCKLTFTNKNSSIAISEKDCSEYEGAGSFLQGEYKKGDIKPVYTLSSLKIVTSSQDSKIKSLINNSQNYNLLVNSFSQWNEVKATDLGTTIKRGGVAGLYTYMEGAIAINKNYYYVAYISSSQKVMFYTNDSRYSKKLPKCFNDWRSRFSKYPVVITYKKI